MPDGDISSIQAKRNLYNWLSGVNLQLIKVAEKNEDFARVIKKMAIQMENIAKRYGIGVENIEMKIVEFTPDRKFVIHVELP